MFSWKKHTSQSAIVCLVVARIQCKGISIEEAIKETLSNGCHCNNPDEVSDVVIRRIRKRVEIKLRGMKPYSNGEYPPRRYRISG